MAQALDWSPPISLPPSYSSVDRRTVTNHPSPADSFQAPEHEAFPAANPVVPAAALTPAVVAPVQLQGIGGTSQAQYLYYCIFHDGLPLQSREAFDASDDFIGRIPRIHIPQPRTFAALKRCIAHREGFEVDAVASIYLEGSDEAVTNTNLMRLQEGSSGTTFNTPIGIVFDPAARRQSISGLSEPSNTPSPQPTGARIPSPPPTPTPPTRRLAPALPIRPSAGRVPPPPPAPPTNANRPRAPPAPPARGLAVPAPAPPRSAAQAPPPPPNRAPAAEAPQRDERAHHDRVRRAPPPWTIRPDGVGEPTLSMTESGKVVSDQRPPGWFDAQVDANSLLPWVRSVRLRSGTVLKNGTDIYVDDSEWTRSRWTKRDGENIYRVIVKDTREMSELEGERYSLPLTFDSRLE